MRISDWSSDVCSSDLPVFFLNPENGVSYPVVAQIPEHRIDSMSALCTLPVASGSDGDPQTLGGLATIKRGTTASVISKYNIQRSEEHTSELQSLMRISYAVFCLKKKNTQQNVLITHQSHIP